MPRHREFNPAALNEGILAQLQPDPFKLNQPFVDQLKPLIPDSVEVPAIESFEPSGNLDIFAQADTVPSSVDDIWHTDNFDILS